jgi:hypothetical protein
MPQDYKKILSQLEAPEPPADLTEKILFRITRHEQRMLSIKIAVSTLIFSVSTAIMVINSIKLTSTLFTSGFFGIASLAFSDFSSIMANFPDFAYSMAESFPIFTTAVLLGGIMFAVWSMAALIDETSLMQAHKFSLSE